jgi:hypothetical protein
VPRLYGGATMDDRIAIRTMTRVDLDRAID